ncbi:RAMP superfamily CRISPR-associated protein [Nocardia sp. CA-119907]|uniref:RAMP superfamily CRISPR-associated protein n=1 Tax=Nocardia sp. CA-119907 TaxID=3239973 RepID=UPI003D99E013
MKTTLFTVRLRLLTPGGVTAPEEQRWDDITTAGQTRTRNTRPLRRDPTGNPHLPGSTIAGSLRAHCCETPELAGMFGPCPDAEDRYASPIQILGVTVRSAAEPGTRGRTAIDRARAAARTHTLHAIEYLVAGTEFDIFLRWDDPTEQQHQALTTRLQHWTPTLGAGASIGAGRCQVVGLGEATYDLATNDGLAAWLALTNPAHYPQPQPVTPVTATTARRTTITFRITDAIHIGTGTTRTGEQGQEITEITRYGDDFVIPGSSLKGALRSGVEYICRVLDIPACDNATCGQCRPCTLFGHASPDTDTPPRRALIAVLDATVRNPRREQRQHVTIDRFTGGAHDRLLFTHDVLVAGEFDLVIEHLTDTDLDPVDDTLLNAVLADLHDGLIGIGARTTAGYGTVEIIDSTWQHPDLTNLTTHLTPGPP